jgi:transcriptional regulator GlxA family with amidase domain
MRWRTVRRVAATVFVGLPAAGAVAAAGIAGATGEASAVDVLAPYEVLASTGAFNLYTVAPQRQPVPLTGGLDLVPDFGLGQLDQRLPTGPEVIVVPQLSEVPSGLPPSVAAIVQWLRRQRAQGDPLLVGVCVGAEVLAKAGLLDGRPATSH